MGFLWSNNLNNGSTNPGADPENINLQREFKAVITTKSVSLSKSLLIEAPSKILNSESWSNNKVLAKYPIFLTSMFLLSISLITKIAANYAS